MTMRKEKKPRNEKQIDLPFDGNLALKPNTSKSEIKPPIAPHKEAKMPPVSEIMARYNAPEPDDDKDEPEYRGKDWKNITPDERRRINESLYPRRRA